MSNSPSNSVLERCVVWIGAASLMLLGVLICASVALRLAGSVISGSAEIGEMLIIIVAATSLVAATFSSAHPYVHMLVDRLSPNRRALMAALIAIVAALFWATAAWVNGKVAIENAKLVEETELLRISFTPFRILWVTSLALTAVVLVRRAMRLYRTDRDRKD